MRFACRPVDLSFIETAPLKFVNEVELDASPEQVFKVLEDEESWPKWFKEIVGIEWTSPKPFGVGTTRTAKLRGATVYEHFIAWDPGKRFTFRLAGASVPIARAFCEDYRLEPTGNGKTRFTYIVAIEPGLLLKLAGPIARLVMGNMLRNGAHSLAAYMKR